MKTGKYLCLGMAALAFAACSNEEDVTNNSPVAAQVSAGIERVQTRAYDQTWEVGDQIGISCTSEKGDTEYTNRLYTISNAESGSFTNETNPIFFQDLEEVTLSAYYPYSTNMQEGIITKTITGTDAQKDIDYMFATGATASKADPYVNFTNEDGVDACFKHRMSRLSFTFNQGDDTDLKNMTDFTISGLKMKGTFDTTDGTAKVADNAETADLTITETPSASNTYSRSLIVFPQTVTGKQFTLSLTLGGQPYSTTLNIPNGADALTTGNDYTYTITVNKTKIVVSKSSIDAWGDGGSGSGSAEM